MPDPLEEEEEVGIVEYVKTLNPAYFSITYEKV